MNFRLSGMWAAFGLLLFTLAGCGGGGGGGNGSTAAVPQGGNGQALISVTDADGDFLSYTVDVQSLTLKKDTGETVTVVPTKTRIDFAQLVDVAEVFTVGSIPLGKYVEATLKLDYSNADVEVEKMGQPVKATVVGTDGKALTTVDVKVTFEKRSPMTVTAKGLGLLALDFNLAASNQVDLTTTPAPTVTAMPALSASITRDSKDFRVRGSLVSVDTMGSNFVVNLNPFATKGSTFGQLTVVTNAATTFEIDGQMATNGAAGLQSLMMKGASTPVLAFGSLDDTKQFTATEVLAGTSVPGVVDTVIGTVLARSGDSLTVKGLTLVRSGGDPTFLRDPVTVTVGAGTTVLKFRSKDMADINDISVGSSIQAFGTFSSNTLDATAGRVRLHPSVVVGEITATSPLVVNLDAINGRSPSAFNFAGTGISNAGGMTMMGTATMDTTPSSYKIDTTKTLPNIFFTNQPTVGDSAVAFGFVTPFGMAPPDFSAAKVFDVGAIPTVLAADFGKTGSTMAFSSTSPTAGLVVNVAATRQIHVGFQKKADLTTSPTIVGATMGSTVYVIASPPAADGTGTSAAFESFADFVNELNMRLSGGTTNVLVVSASGNYDKSTNTLTAQSAVVVLK